MPASNSGNCRQRHPLDVVGTPTRLAHSMHGLYSRTHALPIQVDLFAASAARTLLLPVQRPWRKTPWG